jgi:hypothetical protein
VMEERWSDASNPFGRPLHVQSAIGSQDARSGACMAVR